MSDHSDSREYPWDEIPETRAVDCAGCLWGEVTRPARSYTSPNGFALKAPRAPNGWIRSDDPVDLGDKR